MTTKDIRGSLRRFMEVIAEEADRNEAFAEKLLAAISSVGKPTERSPDRRVKNVELPGDPFGIFQTAGAAGLQAWLDDLDLNQLKRIVRDHRLDPTRNSDKWKTRERFIQLILKRIPARARQGDSFRYYGEQPPQAKLPEGSGVSSTAFREAK
jgi:hypothetical protein